ncbi:ATP-binding protein [Streptomyces sp. XY332]|uniref:ATP-binding protein n=1 Tax=Streptomyces sp. XY332 TaxID=1415561 RepID=UPI00131DC2F2|nr:ATP-binding protein [Streptomyces sp. XY332]
MVTRLQALRASGVLTRALPTSHVSDARWAYREVAALRGSFVAASLQPRSGSATDHDTLRSFIIQDCERVTTAAGSRWRLSADVRTATLDRLRDRDRLLDTLTASQPDAIDIDSTMVAALLRGVAPALDAQTTDELTGTLHAVEWLRAASHAADALAKQGVELPATDDIRRAIAFSAIFQPLLLLADDHFVGRQEELRELAAYVGLLPPDSGDDTGTHEVHGLTQCPRLVVYGPGGVGKSTLLARFLLDQARTTAKPGLPFSYLTFDRADLLPHQPLTLLMEATRQLGLFCPSISDQAKGLEEAVRGTLFSQSAVLAEGIQGQVPKWLDRDEATLIHRYAQLARTASEGRPARLLLLLDTMERAQRQGVDAMDRLWGFLDTLQGEYPQLRVVFAGRSPLGRSTKELPLPGFTPELALTFLRQRLNSAGIKADETFLHTVTDIVGANPLSLRLAAELIRHEGEACLSDLKRRRELLSRLGDAEVQAVLYRRILDDLDNPDLRRVASPGLTLRRITPQLIREVLAVPCGLGKIEADEARRLFFLLAQEATLVERVPGQEALIHRADVRHTMLPLLYRDHPETSRSIHRRAIRHYAAFDAPQARAEELYHRLALGQATSTLDRHWTPEAGALLDSAIDEFPPSSQAYLSNQLRLAVDPAVLEKADDDTWARQAVRKGRALLDSGRPSAALSLLTGRPGGSRRPKIAALEIEALAALGNADKAMGLLAATMEHTSEVGDATGFLRVVMLGARVAEDFEAYDEALNLLNQAAQASDTAGSLVEWLEIRVAQLRVYRRSHASQSPEAAELREAVIQATERMSRGERTRHPTLVRDLAAEVGDQVPSLVAEAARLLGIDAAGEAGEVLSQSLTEGDILDLVTVSQPPAAPTEWPWAPSQGVPGEAAPQSEVDPLQLSGYHTSSETGMKIASYLDTDPSRGPTWTSALVEAYRVEVDKPAFNAAPEDMAG